MERLRLLANDGRLPVVAAFLGAFAVLNGHAWEQYEVSAWPMILVASAALLVARFRPPEAPRGPYRFIWLPATILLLDGITYLQPNPCGPLEWMSLPIWLATYGYLNIMSVTRNLPIALGFAGGFSLLCWAPSRRAGAWSVACALIVILVDAQLHYVGDPGHCAMGH